MTLLNTLSEKEKKIDVAIQKDTVLFVCTGNTCRSPMCAALYNQTYAGLTSFGISAGLCADGSPIAHNAVIALRDCGVRSTEYNNYEAHVSVTVSREMMESATLIVGVTSAHAMALIMRFPDLASKITSFTRDISDPFGGDTECYKSCIEAIDSALSDMFLKGSEKENGLSDSQSDD